MKIYLVGGAVRDKILGIPVNDKDYLVVGSTPEEMVKLGYKPIGKDFPVFLHPKTKDEYALARTERKIGKGYHGFKFYTSPGVTLEEDLRRRDITINAIAEDGDGNIYDPFNGNDDIQNKVKWVLNNPKKCDEIVINAMNDFKNFYSEEVNYKLLLKIYEEIINKKVYSENCN